MSSANRSFVAGVSIHRFNVDTLHRLHADHLVPTLGRLEGELVDLRAAREGADQEAARQAERRYDRARKARDELLAYIAAVEACADLGPPPTDRTCPPFAAPLWPLLDPRWKDPRLSLGAVPATTMARLPNRAAFMWEQPLVAIAAIEKEALRRMGSGTSRTALTELVVLESGLWTDLLHG